MEALALLDTSEVRTLEVRLLRIVHYDAIEWKLSNKKHSNWNFQIWRCASGHCLLIIEKANLIYGGWIEWFSLFNCSELRSSESVNQLRKLQIWKVNYVRLNFSWACYSHTVWLLDITWPVQKTEQNVSTKCNGIQQQNAVQPIERNRQTSAIPVFSADWLSRATSPSATTELASWSPSGLKIHRVCVTFEGILIFTVHSDTPHRAESCETRTQYGMQVRGDQKL